MFNAMIIALATLAAPVPYAVKPQPRFPVRAIVPGRYMMHWAGTVIEARFRKDGSFSGLWGGGWWHGSWSQKNGTLWVHEQAEDASAYPCCGCGGPWDGTSTRPQSLWRVELLSPRSGMLDRNPQDSSGRPNPRKLDLWKLSPLEKPD